MADEIIFWDERNSTADDPISKRTGFGIVQEFRGRLNALQNQIKPNHHNNTPSRKTN
jgi:hypothetical protein